jgi:hypothetical protein
MSEKNNLTFNNLDYQTSTSRLYNINYNLDYMIYKLKQTCTKYVIGSLNEFSHPGWNGVGMESQTFF